MKRMRGRKSGRKGAVIKSPFTPTFGMKGRKKGRGKRR